MVDLSKLAFTTIGLTPSMPAYQRVVTKGTRSFSVASSGFSTINISVPTLNYPYVKLFYRFGSGPMYPMFPGVASYDIAGNGFQVEDIIVAGPPGDWTLIISLGNYSGSTVSGSIYYRAYEI